ncbi:oxalurate catabolism protein HpxZ [Roseicella frigidaeris]|uniref:Oxalurate catabolism protein HpxZ n=1 Tax=Roseicella frigidaeris TaxID=2230885 RepID=A0A327MDX5_9PROT|nr:oxalurate catabolism protein HpxZ [Roseicella frigidaeris]RAI60472.1 oxalurate catabolism protein HpxZ [Roseicella frigidaeris]
MEVDIPEVLAEVRAAFAAYEKALVGNDVAVLQDLFRKDARTLRYGPNEILLGWERIAAFRAARSPIGLERVLENTVITTYGRDFATANTEFLRGGRRGRQSQSWVRFPEGWRIVAAHVSLMPPPGGTP